MTSLDSILADLAKIEISLGEAESVKATDEPTKAIPVDIPPAPLKRKTKTIKKMFHSGRLDKCHVPWRWTCCHRAFEWTIDNGCSLSTREPRSTASAYHPGRPTLDGRYSCCKRLFSLSDDSPGCVKRV